MIPPSLKPVLPLDRRSLLDTRDVFVVGFNRQSLRSRVR
jgi:hypothetical protein